MAIGSPPSRGRKARLSREMITSVAREMLNEMSLEAFTLAGLAKRLDAGVMSLYTYFPNRDALLDAVAEQIFESFETPPGTGRWQDVILDWLWATQRLLERHPVVLKVIFWDEHHSPAWMKTWWLPIARILQAQGLDNPRIAFTMNWFSTSAIGMIVSQAGARQRKPLSVVSHIETLERDEHRLAVELWLCLGDVDPAAALDFGFRNIIQGMEAIVGGTPLPRHGPVRSPHSDPAP
jgi:AcrR family transcriptional regulator